MKPSEFKEQNIIFAKNQPEYLPLPALKEDNGTVTCLWKFSLLERIKVLFTGKLWISVLTFNRPLQPLLPRVEYPFKEIKPE